MIVKMSCIRDLDMNQSLDWDMKKGFIEETQAQLLRLIVFIMYGILTQQTQNTVGLMQIFGMQQVKME